MSELRPAESSYICLKCKYILNVNYCPRCGEKDLATVWEVIMVVTAQHLPKQEQGLFTQESNKTKR